MKKRKLKRRKALALPAIIACTLILTILGFAVLHLAETEITLSRKEINRTKAFYLAEAGLATLTMKLFNKDFTAVDNSTLGEGDYWVKIYYDEDPPYAVSNGKVGLEEKSIKVEMSFLARPYEEAIYAGNAGGNPFVFSLRFPTISVSCVIASYLQSQSQSFTEWTPSV